LARRSALSYKALNNQITVVEDFTFEAPKTKEFINFAKNIKLEGVKMLLVLANENKNVTLSARNIQGANITSAAQLNTYEVLDNKALVLTESSVAVLNEL
jgi:large subunit ribosomal protein L4